MAEWSLGGKHVGALLCVVQFAEVHAGRVAAQADAVGPGDEGAAERVLVGLADPVEESMPDRPEVVGGRAGFEPEQGRGEVAQAGVRVVDDAAFIQRQVAQSGLEPGQEKRRSGSVDRER
jgi:hypothetical protein